MDEVAENNISAEVAPQAVDAQSSDASTSDMGASSPDETQSDKEELILGKFKSHDDLIKSYQELESYTGRVNQSLNDPNFIYQQARKLGLTAEEAQQVADNAQTGSGPAPAGQPIDIQAQFEHFTSLKEAKEKYPDLKSDEEDQLAVTALMRAKGLSPLKAAERYYAKLNKAKQTGEVAGETKATQVITEKERASTAPVGGKAANEPTEEEDIRRRMKSFDKKVQEKAYIDMQLYKARKK